MIKLAKVHNPTATFKVLDSRQIKDLETKDDGIICGFCLPYMSPTEGNELISNSYDLLNENGLIYLSFVEGDHNQSDFKVGAGGRVYFQYHSLDTLKTQLIKMKFDEVETFKVEYKTSETEFDIQYL